MTSAALDHKSIAPPSAPARASAARTSVSTAAPEVQAREHILTAQLLRRAHQLLDESVDVLRDEDGYACTTDQVEAVTQWLQHLSRQMVLASDFGTHDVGKLCVFPYGDSGIEVATQSQSFGYISVVVTPAGEYSGAYMTPDGKHTIKV